MDLSGILDQIMGFFGNYDLGAIIEKGSALFTDFSLDALLALLMDLVNPIIELLSPIIESITGLLGL